ncbi:RNA pseudouridine synthase 7-like isoform X1 [Malus sylvestris]|uniref:RNA pseudouridine synthase 7-like isoform X1 n=1 Tax=Malus sylvestris TaxID=3752 RepID=UPI0021AD3C16|nr:RNA pseudouridine synthase 7-like isoform X1 [Malus sylvestris]
MKSRKEEKAMEIVWQTPEIRPQRQDYIFRDGRRHVRPYNFEFICHVKKRWAGKTIVDLFTYEFKGRPYDYYVSAVKSGRIQVEGVMVPVSYIVKTSQKISHFVHRHEPPVMTCDVSILQEEPDVVVVCKPASVPVHSCGQYRKNTVVGILEAEHGLAPLFRILSFKHYTFGSTYFSIMIFCSEILYILYYTFLDMIMLAIHRLDRLVSGLLILAKSSSKANYFRQQIEGGMVQKQYIARVAGEFPEQEQFVDANVIHDPRECRSTAEVSDLSDDTLIKGKTACTKFTRLSTNGIHSLVLCEPVTGRTHQIRVHLQHVGYPIANDMLYLSKHVNGRSTEGMGADRAAVNSRPFLTSGFCENLSTEHVDPNEDFSIDPMCTNCPNLVPKGYDVHEEALWLHCVRYSAPGWTYECPYPDWASLS